MGILAVDSIKSRTVAPVTISDDLSVTGVSTYTGAITASGGIVGDVTGTATTATNATGLTGSPSITITDVNASGIITATSFAGDGSALTGITQTTINNNANNLVITGSGTANTLEAESQFTYDGTNLQLKKTGSSDYNEIIQDANPSTENSTLGYLSGYWNTTRVADIRFAAGDDTSNKDNAHICFRTTNAGSGSITDRLRIGNLGQIGLPVGGVGVAATDWGSSGQVLTSGGSSAVASWATPAGGGWVPVANNSVSSSDSTSTLCDFSSCFDSTYDHYRIEFTCHYSDISSTGQDYLRFRQYDSGSLRTSSDYDNAVTYSGNGTGLRYHVTGADDHGYLSGNQQNQAFQGRIDVWNVHETTIQATWNVWLNSYWIKQPDSVTNYNNLGINGVICACPSDNTPVAVTGIKIYSSGTNFSNGNVVVYGLKTS